MLLAISTDPGRSLPERSVGRAVQHHLLADQARDPFTEAVRVQERLFSTKPIFLGVEESLKHPVVPCGLKTDAERARHVRKRVRQMLNSRGEWEVTPPPVEKTLREICAMEPIPESALDLLKLRSGAATVRGAEVPEELRNKITALRPANELPVTNLESTTAACEPAGCV